jgi:hypothetical protein
LTVDGRVSEVTGIFKYSGTLIRIKNEVSDKIKIMIAAEKRCCMNYNVFLSTEQ